MSLEENKTLAHKFHQEMLEKKRYDLIDQLVSPSFVAHIPGLPPEFTTGPEGVKKWFAAYHAGMEGIWSKHIDTIAEGDRVVIRFEGGGKHTGNMLGVPPTGKQIKVTGVDIFRISNGKLVEMWQELDFLGMLRQMGAVPG